MPERLRGRKTPPPTPREQDPQPYHRAAKYPDEQSSEGPYDTLQEFIRREPVNLSAYRIRLGEKLDYHVAALGERPAKGHQRRINEILKDGEHVTLPQEVLDALTARRREQQAHGPWVERHHFPRKRRTK